MIDAEKNERPGLRPFDSATEALAWLEKIQNPGPESWRVYMCAENGHYQITAHVTVQGPTPSSRTPHRKSARGHTLIQAIARLRYGIEDVRALPPKKREALKDLAPETAKLIAEVNALQLQFDALAAERDALYEHAPIDHDRICEITQHQKAAFDRLTQIGLEAAACSTPTQPTS